MPKKTCCVSALEMATNLPPVEVQQNIVSVLVRLDREAREAKGKENSAEEVARRGMGITRLDQFMFLH